MKLHQLTFTRFIAAVSIVVFHSRCAIWPFNLPFLSNIFSKANVGVSYFFILSGFVMIIAYGQNKNDSIDKLRYYLNRFARIYPVYLIALIFTIAVTLFEKINIAAKDLLLQIFVIQAWVPGSVSRLNFPGWSLSVEALFYAVFPILFNSFYKKISLKLTVIFVVSIWLTTQIILNYLLLSPLYKGPLSRSHEALFYFPLMHINEFMIGNITGFIYFRLIKKQRNLDLPIIVLFVIMLSLLSFNAIVSLHDGLMAIFFAPIILLMSLNTGKITSTYSNKYLILLGEASYGMYILQYPVKIGFYLVCNKLNIINDAIIFYSYVIFLIVISICCYIVFEIPAKNWIKNRIDIKIRKPKLLYEDDTVNF
jgi:peptidoglycan/LPS O-acetylase OafA/YrhL